MGNLGLPEQIIPQQFIEGIKSGFEHLQSGVATASTIVWNGVVHGIKHADRISKDNDNLENAIRFVANATLAVDLALYGQEIARPISESLHKFRNVASSVRVISSVNYFVGGSFLNDVRQGNVHLFISNIGFLVGRMGAAMGWLAEHKVIGDLSIHLTPKYFVKVVDKIKSFPVIDSAFIVALSGIAFDHILAFARGEGSLYRAVDLVSLSADITLSMLTIFEVTNVVVITVFATVAAGTAVVSFILNPDYV